MRTFATIDSPEISDDRTISKVDPARYRGSCRERTHEDRRDEQTPRYDSLAQETPSRGHDPIMPDNAVGPL